MTVDELRDSLARAEPPADLSPLLRALWLDGRGDWNGAHAIAQDDSSKEAAWVHAYLHRKEGDHGNAAYWYAQARRAPFSGSLEEEWATLASTLIGLAPGR
jgi:hypothetical protein